VQCYQRALSASVHLPGLAGNDVTDVLERLAETLMDIGEMDAAEHALRQARRRAKDDPLRSARLCLATAHHRQHMGRHVDSLRWITRGRSLLGGESSVEASKLRVSLGWRAAYIRYDQGAYKAGLVWARRAVDEARAINDDAAEATALAVTSVLEAAAGRSVDEARMREVMDVYDRIDDQRGKVRAANLFGVCLYFAGKWDAAVRYYAEAEQTFRSIGRDHDAAMVATNRAEVLVQQGRIDEAEALVASAVRVLLGARATSYLGFAITVYGRVALARGDYDVALDRLAEARSMCMEMGEVDEALTVVALVAECLQRAGNPVDALSYAEAALAQMSDVRGEVTAEPALHRVYGAALLAGGWPGGEQALRTSLATARRRGAPNEIFTSLDALLRHGVASDAAEAQTWRAELDELAVQLGIVTTDTDRLLFQPAVPIAVLTEPASGLPPEP
jgi:tetratricopeptide (TPR) repeat protein